jgi:hypothetical protein
MNTFYSNKTNQKVFTQQLPGKGHRKDEILNMGWVSSQSYAHR